MRRIYESRALERDDDDPFAPAETGEGRRWRTVNWARFSHAFVPTALRDRAIAVSLETDRDTYAVGDPVHLQVTFRNRLPFPISIRTRSPVRWSWSVDGVREADRTADPAPDEATLFEFDRSERKTFRRTWHQRIREAGGEWAAVPRGEYALAAWVNVDGADERGLRTETTVTVE